MRLITNDYIQSYYWVDDEDESIHLSPSFDYEEDAIQWRDTIYAKVLRDVLDSGPEVH